MTATDRPAGTRRLASRKVVLTATFLALAAGGTAACDQGATEPDDTGWDATSYTGGSEVADSPLVDDDDPEPDEDSGEDGDEVFYCADEDGEIVQEDNCDDEGTNTYFLWHSTSYPRGMSVGTVLNGGDYFPPGDRAARQQFRLPATGKVANGTIKTNVVGRGSNGSSAGDSGSGGG